MARPKSDIDPKRVNLEGTRKRGRKLRDRPEPLPSQKQGEVDALAKVKRMPVNPGVMLEPAEDGWLYTPPHNDTNLWELEVAASLGTRSHSVVNVFLRDLRKLSGTAWDADLQRWKADETELNAALSMVADIKPRSTQEAALAAQMVAIHWMQMRLSAQALNNGGMILDRDAALASKLARTYTMQLDTLQALRGRAKGTRQTIRVRRESHHHQHMHWHRGDGENDGRPQATDGWELRAAKPAERPALPCPDEINGEVVPFPGDGQRSVSPSRRAKSRRP